MVTPPLLTASGHLGTRVGDALSRLAVAVDDVEIGVWSRSRDVRCLQDIDTVADRTLDAALGIADHYVRLVDAVYAAMVGAEDLDIIGAERTSRAVPERQQRAIQSRVEVVSGAGESKDLDVVVGKRRDDLLFRASRGAATSHAVGGCNVRQRAARQVAEFRSLLLAHDPVTTGDVREVGS